MGSYIVKLEKEGSAYYMEYSTIVDAPVTFGMPLSEFKEYYRSRYGEEAMNQLTERLQRVQLKGTSSLIDNSTEEVFLCNRAGKNETCLTIEQIIEWYCIRRQDPEIEGSDPWEDENLGVDKCLN